MGGALLLGVMAALPAAGIAKVAPEAAARLGGALTPIGAERAASADGAIPEWTGGLRSPPPCFTAVQGGGQGRYCDPFVGEQPLFTITAANAGQYRDHLSAGQLALLERYPDSYRMPVYRTRRSFANPDFIYAATARNALSATLDQGGEALVDAATGIPFPLPETGREVIWNHRTRYRGVAVRRWNNQFAVTQSGDYNRTRFREDILFNYSAPSVDPKARGGVLMYFLQVATAPERLAGSILLIHDSLDPGAEPRQAWQFSPGQRRLRKAPNIGYDNPGMGADGLRTNDQLDTFSGGMDRYEWKLVDKQTLFVPANSYRLHSGALRYPDIVQRNHIDQNLSRYELRRVWVVDATLKANATHQYRRRRFYVDEDGWQIRVVDIHDARNQLWRVQETHTVMAYDRLYELPVCETVYDLQSGRYLVQALNNEDPETAEASFDAEHFKSSSASKLAKE
ncbi:MAG: DUF1329 domain-containing protein [Nevskiales bacterium]|nr:DUF1329 domain-containing protein [Nevskiales bacterium]